MGGQAGNTPPPVANLPWGHVRQGGAVWLDITALQFLQTLWAAVVPQEFTYASLPASPANGQRAFITDSTLPALMNFGAVSSGGGTYNVPVYWDAATASWLIG